MMQWAIATGSINHFKPTSMMIAKTIKSLEGFVRLKADYPNVLWVFGPEENATSALNYLMANNIRCNNEIITLKGEADGRP